MHEFVKRLMPSEQGPREASTGNPHFEVGSWHVPFTVPYESTASPVPHPASTKRKHCFTKQLRNASFQKNLILNPWPKCESILSATVDYARDAVERSSEETLVSLVSYSSRELNGQAARQMSQEYRVSCRACRMRSPSPSSIYSRSVTAVSVRGPRRRMNSATQRRAAGHARSYANSYLQLAEFEAEDQDHDENVIRAKDGTLAAFSSEVFFTAATTTAKVQRTKTVLQEDDTSGDTASKCMSSLHLTHDAAPSDVILSPATSAMNEKRVALLEARLIRLREENFQAFAGGSPMTASEVSQRLQSLAEAAERLRDLKIVTGLAVRELRDNTPRAVMPAELQPLRTSSRSWENDIRPRKETVSGDPGGELETITVMTQPEGLPMERKHKTSRIPLPTQRTRATSGPIWRKATSANGTSAPQIPQRSPRRLAREHGILELEHRLANAAT
ncbi:hypothetical protein CERZMDRAFT_84419 [Cercospora zeae-maydis SCOH1-5]|uniref:Uncharacterized protein n=1 Tax=Cercospora zeae-maydis SCOH1-5 TaxID=717836 RepID=A0A6A6FHA2_9PEZI|nr:hypothetical protein CERZMDRAFT_84419 [Cercospora zeae-maydis SCOH1-5]